MRLKELKDTEIQNNCALKKLKPVKSLTGCSLGTDICNVTFNFYLILILTSFLLFLTSIYREVLLLSGKRCNKLNQNFAKARAFH